MATTAGDAVRLRVVSVRDDRVICDCGLSMSGRPAMKAAHVHLAESPDCSRLVVRQVRVLLRTDVSSGDDADPS